MGASASTRATQLSITDPKLCRSYLVGTCPHDLFTNTKQDLGPCPKVHSEPLKDEYQANPSAHAFEFDYLRDLQKYIDECNRRIDAAHQQNLVHFADLGDPAAERRQAGVGDRALQPFQRHRHGARVHHGADDVVSFGAVNRRGHRSGENGAARYNVACCRLMCDGASRGGQPTARPPSLTPLRCSIDAQG